MEVNQAGFKEKKPLYIKVYDELYKQIMNGTYPCDSQLPTETELAKTFKVSRMTLRQALALLQDDGLVRSVHGKGSFVTRHRQANKTAGLEKIGNPIYKCLTEPIDQIELDFRLDLESEYTQEILNRRAAAVVAIERWYKSKGGAVAFAFTFMAIETVSELNLDLQDTSQLMDLLENRVYEMAHSASIEIKRSSAINSPSQKYIIAGGADQCDLILESLYANEEHPIVYNKFYIPEESSVMKINAVK